ncbi:uncharacterized protein LOC142776295 isoform X3 [Rhipicephalus microplus]
MPLHGGRRDWASTRRSLPSFKCRVPLHRKVPQHRSLLQNQPACREPAGHQRHCRKENGRRTAGRSGGPSLGCLQDVEALNSQPVCLFTGDDETGQARGGACRLSSAMCPYIAKYPNTAACLKTSLRVSWEPPGHQRHCRTTKATVAQFIFPSGCGLSDLRLLKAVTVTGGEEGRGPATQLRTHSENEEPAFVPRMLRGSRQRHCNSLGPPRGQRLFVELVCRLEEIPPAAESTMEDGQISLNPRHHPKTTGPLCSVGEEGDLPACTWENR